MAEGLFRALTADAGDYQVASAGVLAGKGTRMSAQTEEILKKQGLGAEAARFRSQPLTEELVKNATHIFTMTRGHRALVEERFPDAAAKTYLVCEFCPDDDLMGRDVPDPIGLGPSAYQETFEVLRRALPSVRAFIDKTWKDQEPPTTNQP